METYKDEAREQIARFLARGLSFEECLSALDVALANLTQRATPEQLVSLREFILANNDIAMKEMERRGTV